MGCRSAASGRALRPEEEEEGQVTDYAGEGPKWG